MRILYIHNDYAGPSGEEHAAEAIVELLKNHGHQVFWYRRSSAEIAGSITGKIKAFFTGIYNPFAAQEIVKMLEKVKPDIVQVQNLYPLISPSILKPIKECRIPIVMRCPNYRLFCPNGLHLSKGKLCEKCLDFGRELWCVSKNCTNNLCKSIGYALRNSIARFTGSILKNVDIFIVQTEFQKQKFIKNGIPKEKIKILPGMAPTVDVSENIPLGDLVTFVGRICMEKGIDVFLQAARNLPNIPFAVAGDLNGMKDIYESSPSNVKWLGFLKSEQLRELYLNSRIIIISSRWHEGFPNVAVQAMTYARPIVASRIGAIECIIDHMETGMLFEAGSVPELVHRIKCYVEN